MNSVSAHYVRGRALWIFAVNSINSTLSGLSSRICHSFLVFLSLLISFIDSMKGCVNWYGNACAQNGKNILSLIWNYIRVACCMQPSLVGTHIIIQWRLLLLFHITYVRILVDSSSPVLDSFILRFGVFSCFIFVFRTRSVRCWIRVIYFRSVWKKFPLCARRRIHNNKFAADRVRFWVFVLSWQVI